MKQRLSNFGFRVERQTEKYALCYCPFHHDKYASAIIFLDSMWFSCFSCHVSMPASKAAQEAGYGEVELAGSPENFNIDLLLEDVKTQPLTEEALEYLHTRGIDGDFPSYLVSPRSNSGVSFAFKNNRNQTIGLQTRLFPEYVLDKSSRYVFEGKRLPFFGDISGRYAKKDRLFVFEKAFATLKADIASKRYDLGISAISAVGSHFNAKLLDFTDIDTVFFFDNDEAGRKAGMRVKEITGARVVLPGKPLDELTIEEMGEFLRKYKN